MKYVLMVAVIAVAALASAEAPAEGPQTCNKRCDDKYQQCYKDAVEYGYTSWQASQGCAVKRKSCKEECK